MLTTGGGRFVSGVFGRVVVVEAVPFFLVGGVGVVDGVTCVVVVGVAAGER
jgi:hypothetical protein